MKKKLFTLVLAVFSISAFSHDGGLHTHNAKNPGIKFIENKGQWAEEARYKAEIPGGALFLTDGGFVYNFYKESDLSRIHHLTCGPDAKEDVDVSGEIIHHHAYKIKFLGVVGNADFSTEDKAPYYHNYFVGNDRSKWSGNVGVYGKVIQHEVYTGIDLHVYAQGNTGLKYDFIVAPGANPAQIRLAFEGVQPQLTASGDLKISTTVNEVIEKSPVSYQEINGKRVVIQSYYTLENGQLSFTFPEGYNTAYPLVIDPDLVFATYSGGSGSANYSYSTTYDNNGSLYAGAECWGAGWPVTTGAFQTTYVNGHDVGVNKYTPDGTGLIYSTFLGGNGLEYPHAMRVNENNELTVVGSTQSNDFPTSAGAYDSTHNGGRDIYVTHFNSDATALIGSTLIGTTSDEPQGFSATAPTTGVSSQNTTSPLELTFDANGNIWVASATPSSSFPVTANGAQQTHAGATDGVVFQLDPTCSSLMYSTFLGGAGADAVFAIQVNGAGNIVVAGTTQSADFPATTGALHSTAPGGSLDGFAGIINATTGALEQATYLGTADVDQAVNLQVDCADNIYVLGRTQGNYPISPGVYSMPNTDVFIDKLNPTLSASLLSTRLGKEQSGASGSFFPTAFVLDICGNVYVALMNNSEVNGMPLTPDAFSTTADNFWFCALEAGFNDLLFSTYFGDPSSNDHTHVGVNRLDPQGIVYHSVCCASSTWPTSPPNVFSPGKANSSGQDIISFKFDFDAVNVDVATETGQGGNDTVTHAVRGCKSAYFNFERRGDLSEPMTLRYEISGSAINGIDYQEVGDSVVFPVNVDTAQVEIKPLLNSSSSVNPQEVIFTVLSPCGCEDGSQNIVSVDTILIYDSLYVEIPTPPETVCANDEIEITAVIDSTLDFTWQPAALIPDPLPFGLTIHPKPTQTTDYTITVTQPGAPSTCPPNSRTYRAVVEQYPQITMPSSDTTLCLMPGDSIDLVILTDPAGVDYLYQWSPADYLRDDFSAINRFSAPVGEYMYHVNVSTPEAGCSAVDSMLIRVVPPFEIESVTPMDTTIKLGDRIQLHANGEANGWLWLPVTYLDDPISPSPFTQPREDIIYEVIGTDQYGCRDTAEVKIRVEYGSNTFIPSAFSPNGDGINDLFNIANMRYERLLEFKVFNRYGQVVFESKDGKKGWDGTVNGEQAATDTYFYIIRVVVPFENEPRLFKGDVTLLR